MQGDWNQEALGQRVTHNNVTAICQTQEGILRSVVQKKSISATNYWLIDLHRWKGVFGIIEPGYVFCLLVYDNICISVITLK